MVLCPGAGGDSKLRDPLVISCRAAVDYRRALALKWSALAQRYADRLITLVACPHSRHLIVDSPTVAARGLDWSRPRQSASQRLRPILMTTGPCAGRLARRVRGAVAEADADRWGSSRMSLGTLLTCSWCRPFTVVRPQVPPNRQSQAGRPSPSRRCRQYAAAGRMPSFPRRFAPALTRTSPARRAGDATTLRRRSMRLPLGPALRGMCWTEARCASRAVFASQESPAAAT